MHIDVQARGFSLSRALESAVEGEALQYALRSPKALASVRIRLFDTNGPRGGSDKACLIQARLRKRRKSIVASHVDSDLYRAIAAAFAKLERGTRSVLGARKAKRRATEPWLPAAHVTEG
jgi:putative sigma-54 modulation protein